MCYDRPQMSTAFIVLLSVIALVWLLFAVSPAHRATFRHKLASGTRIDTDAALPAVTIVVPARNEAAWLPVTVPTYCDQNYPDVRVVVVDDQSEDESPAILRELAARYGNLRVVEAPARPAGWCGKPWAVSRGAAAAGTDWLLFTDADCTFHPLAVRQAVRLMLATGYDLLSLLPTMTFGSTIERVALPGLVTAISMLYPVGWANDPRRAVALAAGAFILVRRAAYEKIGGHGAVRSQLIEDINLARKIKASGARVHVRMTTDLVSTRMYEGLADLWEGLTKNAYAGMEYHPLKFWAGLVAALAVTVLPPVYLLACVTWLALRPQDRAAWAGLSLAGLVNLLVVATHLPAVRFLRLPAWHAFLLPVSSGIYTVIAVASAWQHHFGGGNVWKGRRYDRDMLLAGTRD